MDPAPKGPAPRDPAPSRRLVAGVAIAGALWTLPMLPAEPMPDAAEGIDVLDGVVELHLDAGESFRLVPLSAGIVYAQLASEEVRRQLFEGVPRDRLATPASRLTLTLPRALLAEAYAGAERLTGLAADFRDALLRAGFLSPTGGKPERVLITMVESIGAEGLYDFSYSSSLEATTERRESLDRLGGRSGSETTSLKFGGADHPTVATFDTWRFDDLPERMEAEEAREAERRRELRVRKARLAAEVVRALFVVDPTYESAVVGWIERLEQTDVNRLAQLLQIAGYREMSPEVLVHEVPPHLFDPSVLEARLHQSFETVTVDGRRGRRQLDPEHFPDAEVRQRAAAFYGGFFVADGKDGYRRELRPEVRDFIRRQSERFQTLTRPFLDRHLGAAETAG